MPAFGVNPLSSNKRGAWGGGGATGWGGGAKSPAPTGDSGSNPLPSTTPAPAGQVYGGGQSSAPAGGGGFGGGRQPSFGAAPPTSGHWDMGEQGAAGAWSNGYNPQWERDQPGSAGSVYAQQGPQQSAAPAPGVGGNPDNNPRGMNNGFGDARDNVNEFQSVFYDPTKNSYYNDFDNEELRSNVPGGRQVSLAEAGITPGSAGDPDSGWQGMKKRDNATAPLAYAIDEDPYATAMAGYR